jgi:anti-sigma regulatory factor (Ser/Thr protein kinase)
VAEQAATGGLRHVVFFYAGPGEFRDGLARFVQDGINRREPVLIAVPYGQPSLADWVPSHAALVTVMDMAELGRNPARVIPALRAFADRHHGHRPRMITESVWPGRSAAEVCEAARHEVLVEMAMAGILATVLCPYSTAGLPQSALADAARSHMWQLGAHGVLPSPDFSAADAWPAGIREPLPSPPASAETVQYHGDLRPVRAMVAAVCQRAGLSTMRATDLTLAVSEVAANTLRHTDAGGRAQAWLAGDELVCQISDSGQITDPLAGVLRPAVDQPGGHGLWLVNQICDLVELRSGQAGTVVRLHMGIRRG